MTSKYAPSLHVVYVAPDVHYVSTSVRGVRGRVCTLNKVSCPESLGGIGARVSGPFYIGSVSSGTSMEQIPLHL